MQVQLPFQGQSFLGNGKKNKNKNYYCLTCAFFPFSVILSSFRISGDVSSFILFGLWVIFHHSILVLGFLPIFRHSVF